MKKKNDIKLLEKNISIEGKKHRQRNPLNHPYRYGKQLINKATQIWKKNEQRCVICGVYGETTREHCPPQAFYTEMPNDIITVPSCSDCQKSPDREFVDMLAFECKKRPTLNSTKLLKKVEARFKTTKTSRAYSDYFLNNSKHRKNEADPISIEYQWPQGFHDPMIIKFAHAYFWVLNEGRVLSDMPGRLFIIPFDNPNTPEGQILTGNAHPSVNIGEDQFITTLNRGFDEKPPFNTTFIMGFHFLTNNSTSLGYHTMVVFLLDQYKGLNNDGTTSFNDLLKESETRQTYDTQKPVHKLYPY